jgi:UDP-N-acetylmuramate dehydrogenase
MFQKNISLKPFNTFGLNTYAENYISVSGLEQLKTVIAKYKDVFILSGGSNILLTQNIIKPVIHLNLKGIEIIEDQNQKVLLKVQAGENWHEFVLWCIANQFGGIENLSLIPGNVGTGPMQNIGAYGVEIKDVFWNLEAMEITTGKIKVFDKEACNFGYRDSVFKNFEKGKYIIVNVTLELTKKNHKINTSYGAIKSELEKNNIHNPSLKDISDAVITIRKNKLPDPEKIGNSGSFFKNPVISFELFKDLEKNDLNIPHYNVNDDLIKVPAGWLIEQCGFKGKRYGDAGVHKKQALVLVNYGQASGKEILNLALKIKEAVLEKFGIDLEMEVNII